MSTPSPYDSYKQAASEAYHRKEAAYEKLCQTIQRRTEALKELNTHWRQVCAAQQHFNDAYQQWDSAMKAQQDRYTVLSQEADKIFHQADLDHQKMHELFDEAQAAFLRGDKAEAALLSQEAHDYHNRRNQLNQRHSVLTQRIKDLAPDLCQTYLERKTEYEKIRAEHARMQATSHQLKFNQILARLDFHDAKGAFEIARATYRLGRYPSAETEAALAQVQLAWPALTCANPECRQTFYSRADVRKPNYCPCCAARYYDHAHHSFRPIFSPLPQPPSPPPKQPSELETPSNP